MNKIWVFLIVISIIYGIASGNIDQMKEAVLNVPKDALSLTLTIGGLIIFYNGLFKIAIDAGLIKNLSNLFKPFIRKIFPDVPKDHIANEYIGGLMVANLLGLGVASTPMCLKAMESLQEINKQKDIASNSMITLMMINISSFTLLPITIIGIRETFKAKINLALIPMIIVITFLLTIISITINMIICKLERK